MRVAAGVLERSAQAAPLAASVTAIVNTLSDAPLSPADSDTCQIAGGPGICTLRAAVMLVNRYGSGTIILPGGTTYLLYLAPSGSNNEADGDLDIKADVNIVGEGAQNTIIESNGTHRVFHVHSGHTVNLSHVTVRGGHLALSDPYGGGIKNDGTLTVNDSIITGTFAYLGGGLSNSGTLILNNSTVSQNVGEQGGGGIFNEGGTLRVTNSTISENTVNAGNGGGLYHVSGSVTLRNATILLNKATRGQGIDNFGALRLANTIVAENSHISGGAREDCRGTITSDGYNLVGVNNCGGFSGGSGDQTGSSGSPLDPLVDYLLHFGGGTLTHALKPDSPAINAGNVSGCTDADGNPLGTDQRGYFRAGPGTLGADTRCDIGAYEYASLGGDVNGDGDVTSADWNLAPGRWHTNWRAWDADATGLVTMRDLMRERSCLDLRNTNGLVSLWRAEYNFDDALCRNHAWQRGDMIFVPGKAGQGFDFFGDNDYLLVPDAASLEPAQVTLEAWVRHSGSPGTFVYVAAKGAGFVAASYALYTGGDGGMYFYIYNPAAAAGATSPGSGTFPWDTFLWDGNWHHVAGTYDGATVRLYVDGSQIGTDTAGASGIGYGQPDDNLYIGVYGFGFGWYTGGLDDIAVWSRALSAAEVCQRAQQQSCP